jgi:hypothetical protein
VKNFPRLMPLGQFISWDIIHGGIISFSWIVMLDIFSKSNNHWLEPILYPSIKDNWKCNLFIG